MTIKKTLKRIGRQRNKKTPNSQDWGNKKTGFKLCVLGLAATPSALVPWFATLLLLIGIGLILMSSA